MREVGVLDVGCHSALLAVVRSCPGAEFEHVYSRKVRLRLQHALDPAGRLEEDGVRSVERAVARTVAGTPYPGGPVFAFATSVIRDAPNRDEVIGRVARATGMELCVLSGQEEARLAYVAARRWAGRGRLLVLDIGGGTVEVAAGKGGRPRRTLSLPLGARRVTRERLGGGEVSARELAGVRRELRHRLAAVPDLPGAGPGVRVLACSKTFEQLAALTAGHLGAPHMAQRLTLDGIRTAVSVLADTPAAERGRLPGISRHRAGQSLAGALVAEALFEACGAESAEICPWSTREGLLLERLAPAEAARRGTRRCAG